MTVGSVFCFVYIQKSNLRLCHLIHGKSKTGYFPRRSILMINTLLGSLVQSGCCSSQRGLGSFLVTCLNGSVYLLDRCLDAGLDRLISLSLGSVH